MSALGELTAAHPEILAVEIFIVLLFIFVDIIPITMKLLTPISEYDAIRHTLLQDRMVREQIKQEVIHSDAHRDALRAAAADAFATMGEADIIAHQSEAITRRYIDHKIEFERVFRTLSGNDTRVAGQVAAITEIEDTGWRAFFRHVWGRHRRPQPVVNWAKAATSTDRRFRVVVQSISSDQTDVVCHRYPHPLAAMPARLLAVSDAAQEEERRGLVAEIVRNLSVRPEACLGSGSGACGSACSSFTTQAAIEHDPGAGGEDRHVLLVVAGDQAPSPELDDVVANWLDKGWTWWVSTTPTTIPTTSCRRLSIICTR